ncbi:MAG: murein transglycosylase A [Aphanothece sp. CMT-3BRIN-NPC111]|jgi:membrane-bound lytic murein transglycosylase A|nr:murein transglycosylase A [Aphanothece sp. CMT-3BRIN-NPC111]
MRKTFVLLSLSLSVVLGFPSGPSFARMPLQSVNQAKVNAPSNQEDLLGLDDQLWGNLNQAGDRQALLTSIDNSLRYLKTAQSARVYRNYPVPGITHSRVLRSLVRFRQLVVSSNSPEELQDAVRREFAFYQSVGNDDKGTVVFTAYYEPTYSASRTRTAEYRYPLYRLPKNFSKWQKPQPTRAQLEGNDGLPGEKSPLRGLELVWMRDRLEAFLVQIEGSARLQLTDGTEMTVGYAGKTDYAYTSIGKELAKDGKLPLAGLTLPVMLKYFNENPTELSNYLPRNRGFVFFRETHGAPAMGSINVPVTAERSIATDKSLMPPGALALIHTHVPYPNATGQMEHRLVSRYVLDQDTGSAIKGPGRVDYYLGTGTQVGDRAGVTGGPGKLYYLLLKS